MCVSFKFLCNAKTKSLKMRIFKRCIYIFLLINGGSYPFISQLTLEAQQGLICAAPRKQKLHCHVSFCFYGVCDSDAHVRFSFPLLATKPFKQGLVHVNFSEKLHPTKHSILIRSKIDNASLLLLLWKVACTNES